ncbi:TetR/AcrR family transcriptional regulator [Conexibacter sp. JD483]|uniref:TetR/AcrR family transcriptional regulator n=1 Tax=unclassified Conexibacter TaxID=2627773 RepID=UPI002723744F|nr:MULTISPECIES: TetR/AcrR family transcriptional regulator [unclassified Conexibacter]MDO8189239.1 TetR/AcrR family transcriptional regulator [Conexibacter sp. CPCC 205706]MDO8198725.1 TetR/AcrR family transcriptional regulator [Conexibacter sp. CPCC 205762]MDR9372112.1 TetR/AcrR family transcriptional regulator [Conexibacter sp. JD483]
MPIAHVNENADARGISDDDLALWRKKERFFRAIAAASSEIGYANLAVADVLRYAGMSRRTFYELFEDKEDCFLQAYDAALLRIRMLVGSTYHRAEQLPLRRRIELCLGELLAICAAEPELAHLCVVDVLAAGPVARERRDEALAEFAAFIEHPRSEARGTTAPRLVCEAIVGGLYAILYRRVARGQAAQLPSLLGEMMDAGLGQLVDADGEV